MQITESEVRQALDALLKLDEAFCADDYGTWSGRHTGRVALIRARESVETLKQALARPEPDVSAEVERLMLLHDEAARMAGPHANAYSEEALHARTALRVAIKVALLTNAATAQPVAVQEAVLRIKHAAEIYFVGSFKGPQDDINLNEAICRELQAALSTAPAAPKAEQAQYVKGLIAAEQANGTQWALPASYRSATIFCDPDGRTKVTFYFDDIGGVEAWHEAIIAARDAQGKEPQS